MEFLTGLSAVKTAGDVLAAIQAKLGQPSIEFADIQAKLLQLSSLILDARQSLMGAQEENLRLRKERDEALEKLALAEDMDFVLDGQFYVRKSESANGLIPYCPTCWKAEGKSVHLKLASAGEYYSCTIHPTWKYQTQAQEAMAKERIAQARSGPSVMRSNWWER